MHKLCPLGLKSKLTAFKVTQCYLAWLVVVSQAYAKQSLNVNLVLVLVNTTEKAIMFMFKLFGGVWRCRVTRPYGKAIRQNWLVQTAQCIFAEPGLIVCMAQLKIKILLFALSPHTSAVCLVPTHVCCLSCPHTCLLFVLSSLKSAVCLVPTHVCCLPCPHTFPLCGFFWRYRQLIGLG